MLLLSVCGLQCITVFAKPCLPSSHKAALFLRSENPCYPETVIIWLLLYIIIYLQNLAFEIVSYCSQLYI